MSTQRKQCNVYLTDKANHSISHYQNIWRRSKSEVCNIALEILDDLLDGNFSMVADPWLVIIGNYAFNCKFDQEDRNEFARMVKVQ